jgi:hypothetical protein
LQKRIVCVGEGRHNCSLHSTLNLCLILFLYHSQQGSNTHLSILWVDLSYRKDVWLALCIQYIQSQFWSQILEERIFLNVKNFLEWFFPQKLKHFFFLRLIEWVVWFSLTYNEEYIETVSIYMYIQVLGMYLNIQVLVVKKTGYMYTVLVYNDT